MGSLVNVAVLFTDLVGSTALATRVGPEAAEVLRREHFSLLRGCVERNGGREVKNLGDGLMVVFDGPTAAVAAGVEMQQRLEQRNRALIDGEPVLIRVGIAVGECDTDDDGDLFGPPVVEAARLCAAADDSQVLAADLVRLLVGVRGGHVFTALGTRELKGLPEPVVVCEASWAPLPDPERPATDAVPLPVRLSTVPPVFSGRAAEAELLASAWKSVEVGDRRAFVVAGEAGIGKTTLISRFATDMHASGAIVTYGRCDEGLGVAHQPWIESLGHLVEHLPIEVLDSHVERCGGALARLVPGLGARATVPPAETNDPESDRYLLFVAVADLLGRAGRIAPVLVVLDDLHWADRATVQLLRHVVASPDVESAMVVATYRQTDVDMAHPLVEGIAALRRVEGVEFIDLVGLNDLELLNLLELAAGHELPEQGLALRDALVAETDGNPFFTLEILRHLTETGTLRQDADGHWGTEIDLRTTGLPVSVRQVVGQRVAQLGEPVERVLRQAAVIGRDFDLDLLAAVTDMDADDLLDLLDPAVEASVVLNVSGSRFTFAHALIEHTLYVDMAPARRARTHHRIAIELESRCGTEPGERVGELAHHWAAAVVPDDARKAAEWARRAGEHALEQLAPDEAVRWFAQALDLIETGVDDLQLRCEVLIGLGAAERIAGLPAHRERLLEAGHLADRLDRPDLLTRAAVANNRGQFSRIGAVDAEKVELLERALDTVADNDLRSRAQLLATLSTEVFWIDEPRSATLYAEALAVARRLDDPGTLCEVLSLYTWVGGGADPSNLDEREMVAREALALAGGDPMRRRNAFGSLFQVLLRRGDRGGLDACLAEGSAIVERVAIADLQRSELHDRTMAAMLRGELALAESHAEAALAYNLASGDPDALESYGIVLMSIRYHQGRIGELEELIAQTVAVAAATGDPTEADYRITLAAARAALGSLDEAGRTVREVTRSVGDMRRDTTWPTLMALIADTALVVGDREAAATFYDTLLPFADQVSGIAFSTCEGFISHRLGCLAALLGRTDEAIAWLEHALEGNRRFESPIHIAGSAFELSRVLAARDPERAAELMAEAEALKAACGLEKWPAVGSLWSPP